MELRRLDRQIRYVVSLGALLLALTVASLAQAPGGGGPPTPAMELKRMTQALSLTEPQQSTILPILEQRHTAMEVLMKQGRTTEGEQQMHTIMDSSNKEIRAVLSEAQQKVFDAMRPGPPPGGQGPSGQQGGPPAGGANGKAPPTPPQG